MSDTTQAGQAVDKSELLGNWIDHHVNPVAHGENAWQPTGFLEVNLPDWLHSNSLMAIIVTALVLLIFGVLVKKELRPVGRLTNFFESFILYVRNDIVIANMGKVAGKKWTPFFLSIFFLILGCNLWGLIPGNSTATGSFLTAGALASVIFLCMTVVMIVTYGPVKWFKAFMPPGIPGWVLVLLTPLEILGLGVKCVSLTIRLFANMMAGHIVLFSILGLVYVYGLAAAPAFLIGVGIFALEVFVAFLQAYVFTLLGSMFIGEVIHHIEHADHHGDEAHAH